MQCEKIESPKKQSPKIEGTEIQMLEKIMSEKGVWRKIECKEKAVQWNLSARKMSVWKISASMGQKKECKQFQHLHTMGCPWYIVNGQGLKVASQKMEVTVSTCFSGKWIPDIRFWTLFCLWYGKHFWPSPINYYILWTTLCMHTCLFSNPWKNKLLSRARNSKLHMKWTLLFFIWRSTWLTTNHVWGTYGSGLVQRTWSDEKSKLLILLCSVTETRYLVRNWLDRA